MDPVVHEDVGSVKMRGSQQQSHTASVVPVTSMLTHDSHVHKCENSVQSAIHTEQESQILQTTQEHLQAAPMAEFGNGFSWKPSAAGLNTSLRYRSSVKYG